MKLKNLLFSIAMVCLAVLVMVGATVPAMQFHAQALALNAADASLFTEVDLFDAKGNYTVDKDYLKKAINADYIFKFFGYEWRVVYVNDDQNVATFWMVDPFTSSAFNQTNKSYDAGIAKDGSNIWSNGYTGAVWNSQSGDVNLGQSTVRELLSNEAERLLNDKNYAHYVNKVVKGSVFQTNEEKTTMTMEKLYYAKDINDANNANGNLFAVADNTNVFTANYGLGTDSVLWLPSVNELTQKWNVHENVLQWTETTNNGGFAWLRTPYIEGANSKDVVCVASGYPEGKNTIDYLFDKKQINDTTVGVRPAIHLNIGELDPVASAVDSWFNEDWLKVLFIVVCVLGIIGVALVTTAVIVKSRQKKAK